MMRDLHTITLDDFLTEEIPAGSINLSYQVFGQSLGTAEVVLVNHALTGNSNVAGEDGWWKSLVGFGEVIDLNYFTVVCFNIPGNGYCGNPENLIENYKDYTTKDIAAIFWRGLEEIGIHKLFAVIGGSLGGGIAWEMGFLRPDAIQYIIPVATNYKATDWLIGNVLVQDQILNNSAQPIHDARLHAMLLYRTPQSLQSKFKTEKKGRLYDIESWLLHHGQKLEQRFLLKSYKLMNHLLKTIGEEISEEDLIEFATKTNAGVIQVAINTDYFFTPEENRLTYQKLVSINERMQYCEIDSIHGHDAFLMEYGQLNTILEPVFKRHNN